MYRNQVALYLRDPLKLFRFLCLPRRTFERCKRGP
jgi:hypothetical protein